MKNILVFIFLLGWSGFALAQSAPPAQMQVIGSGGTPCLVSAACPVPDTGGSVGGTIFTKPGTYTEVPLDVATTTTANTAVTALIAGHRSAGGWITNPVTATTVICVNFLGTAAFSSGACVGSNNGLSPGVSIPIPPNANAVSVVSSDATHAFSGEGLQ